MSRLHKSPWRRCSSKRAACLVVVVSVCLRNTEPPCFTPSAAHAVQFSSKLVAQARKRDEEVESDTFPAPDARHYVLGSPLHPPWPAGTEEAMFGMGCFWSSERLFWSVPGVFSTQVGFAGGATANPRYDDICGGKTGHAEVVRVIYDPNVVPYLELLRIFWEGHDPTMWNRQGEDRGTEYRSMIFFHSDEQREAAMETMTRYGDALMAAGITSKIRTEVVPSPAFYYAEEFHQQCDARLDSPGCSSLRPTGVRLPPQAP